MGKPIDWTEEMQGFILDNYYGVTTKELTARLNDRFGMNLKWTAVAGYKKRKNLCNGIDARFKKGRVSHNKGQKMPKEMYDKAKVTMFKKGHVPHNHLPVGSEVVRTDGYVQVKVAEPRKWKLKHRLVWEEANGPLPRNYVLLFLDGNKANCDLSNLKLIHRSELLTMMRYHLFQDSAELNDVASNLARVIEVSNSAKKERKKKEGNKDASRGK